MFRKYGTKKKMYSIFVPLPQEGSVDHLELCSMNPAKRCHLFQISMNIFLCHTLCKRGGRIGCQSSTNWRIGGWESDEYKWNGIKRNGNTSTHFMCVCVCVRERERDTHTQIQFFTKLVRGFKWLSH